MMGLIKDVWIPSIKEVGYNVFRDFKGIKNREKETKAEIKLLQGRPNKRRIN